jgi:hypothetical protein
MAMDLPCVYFTAGAGGAGGAGFGGNGAAAAGVVGAGIGEGGAAAGVDAAGATGFGEGGVRSSGCASTRRTLPAGHTRTGAAPGLCFMPPLMIVTRCGRAAAARRALTTLSERNLRPVNLLAIMLSAPSKRL